MNRPFAVTLLAILAGIAGIIAIMDTLRYLGILPIAALGELTFFTPSINWLGALLAALVAVIWFSVARQLWNLDPRGWSFVVMIAIIYLVFDFIAVLGGTTMQAMWPSILVSGLTLILAILPGTKAAFGQR